jgi:hypothetical protein
LIQSPTFRRISTSGDTGVSESLSLELAPFNIRVLLIDLGAYSTNFVGSLVTPAKGLSKPYKSTPADKMLQMTKAMASARLGDPAKAAQRILEVVTGTGMGDGEEVKGCLRIVLGNDCMKVARGKWREFGRNLDVMEEIAGSTAFEE